MSDKDDGGTAFPVGSLACGSIGMSLRDYFAAQAMSAILIQSGHAPKDEIAKSAYVTADAMLKVRNVKT